MAPGKHKRKLSDAGAGNVAREDAEENRTGPPQKRQQQRRSLFVHALAPQTTTQSLIEHFSQSLPIKHATAVVDPSTKLCKGYGFVTFADAEDAQRAVQELNGSVLLGKKIKLEVAEPRHREAHGDDDDTLPAEVRAERASKRKEQQQREREKQAAEQKPQPAKLIVRNLPWSIKEPEQLSKLFLSYGKVKSAVIPKQKGNSGLLAGFGFVVIRGKKNAEKALQGVNGKEVDGRTLAVDWAVDREAWEEQMHADKASAAPADDSQKGEPEVAKGDQPVESPSDLEDESEDNAMNGDAEGEDDDEEDEDDEDDESEDDDDGQPEDLSPTLFIRNLPFTTTDDDLKDHFAQFGPVRYARVVLDPNTERSRGTAFVCFFEPEDAQACLRQAPRLQQSQSKDDKPPLRSILQSEQDDPSGRYTIEGRVLQVARAVDKTEATRLTEEGVSRRDERDKDKRRLFLLSEGTISSRSPLYQLLSPSEIAMRESSAKQRKSILQSNPSLHLSLTRLSIRNVPRTVTSKDLKALAREAVVGFAKDVKAGKREKLSKEELARGGAAMVEAEKNRKKRGVGVVKQAKVVFEGREGGKVSEESGAGRSRGYGFVEYSSHRWALMGLRWLNGHAIDYRAKENNETGKKHHVEEIKERKKRLVVEFAIENAQVVNRRKDREIKSRERPKVETKAASQNEGKGPKFSSAAVTDSRKPKAGPQKPRGAAATHRSSNDDAKQEVDKLAKRQRIISKKRAVRRDRKRAAKA